MIVIAFFLLGALFGWNRARKLNGSAADQVQYALGFALAFTVIGLFLTIFIDRMT